MSEGPADPGYCAAEVRRWDRDRYLCTLFAPRERRRALFALYAFNLEVAKVPEVVSEPVLGEMRLEWWREALDGLYHGAPPAHQVALDLAAAHQVTPFSRGHFERLLEARRRDLGSEPPQDLAALEDYAEATSAGLLHLVLEALAASDNASRAAARHVGIAWALIGLVRAVPFHRAQGRLFLPTDLMLEAGLAAEDVLHQRNPEARQAVVAQVLDRARHHLAAARGFRREVDRDALPALLPAALADRYLVRLAHLGNDPFAGESEIAVPLKVLRLWRAARSGNY